MVSNKIDLYEYQEVSEVQGKELAQKHNYKFYSVSAKTNQQSFINCLDDLIKDHILTFYPELLKNKK